MVGVLVLDGERNSIQAGQVEIGSRLLMLSQRLSRQAREASLGEDGAFQGLEDSQNAVKAVLNALKTGDAAINVKALGSASQGHLASLNEIWAPLDTATSQVVENQKSIANVRASRDKINDIMPLLLAQSDAVVDALVAENADLTLINLAGRQRTLTNEFGPRLMNSFWGQLVLKWLLLSLAAICDCTVERCEYWSPMFPQLCVLNWI